MGESLFAERELLSGDQPVICRVFAPTLEPGGEFKCVWTIDWGPRQVRGHACGIDGIQALMLALRTVHTELVETDDYRSGRLTYLGERDLGLPPPYAFDDPA